MIEYWHWHTLHFGAETYWGGVLPHSGRPRPDLRGDRPSRRGVRGGQVAGGRPRTGHRHHDGLLDGQQVADGEVPASVHCGRRTRSCRVPPVLRLVVPRRVRRPPAARPVARGSARQRPVLVVPALYLVDDATIDWLAAYANAGGHLGWPTLPEPVTVTTGTSLDGRRVHVVHNWSWEPTSADRRGSITQTAVGGGNQVWTLVPHGSRHLIENVATGAVRHDRPERADQSGQGPVVVGDRHAGPVLDGTPDQQLSIGRVAAHAAARCSLAGQPRARIVVR